MEPSSPVKHTLERAANAVQDLLAQVGVSLTYTVVYCMHTSKTYSHSDSSDAIEDKGEGVPQKEEWFFISLSYIMVRNTMLKNLVGQTFLRHY